MVMNNKQSSSSSGISRRPGARHSRGRINYHLFPKEQGEPPDEPPDNGEEGGGGDPPQG